MTAKELIDYIQNIPRFQGVKNDLSTMEELMRRLGDPQEDLKCIHVAGTNGKGSVCAMMASVLKEAGYRVGLYTSPHLVRFNERIQVQNEEIKDDEVLRLGQLVLSHVHAMVKESWPQPMFFDIVTAIAFLYYKEQKVDFVVLETGLGGRLDATNIVKEPLLSIITPIALDHQFLLGDTLEEIAREKAGIIKKNRPVVLCSSEERVYNGIKQVSLENNACLYVLNSDNIIHSQKYYKNKQIFSIKTPYYSLDSVETSLIGDYQPMNAATTLLGLSILIQQGISVTPQHMLQGIKNTEWPGRMEVRHGKQRRFILDGAHNMHGVQQFLGSLPKFLTTSPICIAGFNKDKDYMPIARSLKESGIFNKIILTPIASPRTVTFEELQELGDDLGFIQVAHNIDDAIELALKQTEIDDTICITGSFYLIGEATPLLKQ